MRDPLGPSSFSVANLLVQARQDLGISQTAAGALVGITQAEWSAYERGKRVPPLHKVQSILNACGWRLRVERMDVQGRGYALGKDSRGTVHTWDGRDTLVLRGGEDVVNGFLGCIGYEGAVRRPKTLKELDGLCARREPCVVLLPNGLGAIVPDPEVFVLSIGSDASGDLRGGGLAVRLRLPLDDLAAASA